MVAYRDSFGLKPICRGVPVAPSAVRSRLSRPISVRETSDESLKPKIRLLFDDNHQVYALCKIKAGLRREYGLIVGKDRVCSLMRELNIRGMRRGKIIFTTKPDKTNPRAPDLVKDEFTAPHPNVLWVSDLTYVSTWSGFVCVAVIIDV